MDELKLLKHAEWADALVWTTVLEDPASRFDERMRYLMHHIHIVQHAFRNLWIGERVEGFPDLDAFDDPRSLAAWGREAHEQIHRYLAAADCQALDRIPPIPWAERLVEVFGRTPGPVTVRESAIQVAMHTAHHRGQVTARLRELGAESPLLDFIAWLWMEKPEPQWP